jgi:hypothetical protein
MNNIFSGGELEFTPQTIHQALTCPQRDNWIKVIDQEMDRINERNCFKICSTSDQCNKNLQPIKSKFVFKHKLLPDNIYKYRARL